MRFYERIADFGPAILTTLCLSVLAGAVAFAVVFLISSHFALGLDFLIITGAIAAITVAVAAFVLIFQKIRSSLSN
jgi:hypothetical protein